MLRALVLLLLLGSGGLASLAGAASARTLLDFEEPVVAQSEVLDFTVTPEEAGQPAVVVFLGDPARAFGLSLYRPDGTIAYERNASRGIQALPALQEGVHKFFVRGEGAFQVTNRSLDRLGGRPAVTDANETLQGGADAWVLVPTRAWNLRVEGNVTAELRDLGGATRQLAPAASTSVSQGAAYVLTLRGANGTAYRAWLEPVGADPGPTGGGRVDGPPSETPAPGLLVLALAFVGAAHALRRRRA